MIKILKLFNFILIAYLSIYQNQVSAFCFFSCEREEAKNKIIEKYFTKCGDSYFFGLSLPAEEKQDIKSYLVEFKDVTVVEIDGKPTEPTLADKLNQEEPKWIGFFKIQAGAHRMYDSDYTGPHFAKNYAELGKFQQAFEVPELEEWRQAADTKTFITVSRWSKGWSKWKSDGGLLNDHESHFIATKYKDNSWKIITEGWLFDELNGDCSMPNKATKSD